MIIAGDIIRICRLRGRTLLWQKYHVYDVSPGYRGYWVAHVGDDVSFELYQHNHIREGRLIDLERMVKSIMDHRDYFGWTDGNLDDPNVEVVRYLSKQEKDVIESAECLRQRINTLHQMSIKSTHQPPCCFGCFVI